MTRGHAHSRNGSGDSGFEFSVYISMAVSVWLEFGSQKDSTWLLTPCVLKVVACCGLFWTQLYCCGMLRSPTTVDESRMESHETQTMDEKQSFCVGGVCDEKASWTTHHDLVP